MISENTYVKCSKLSAVDKPDSPTAAADDYEYGNVNLGVSVPVDYWVTGELKNNPEVGQPLYIARDCRNGVRVDGDFRTSPVVNIESDNGKLKISTRNSVYLLEEHSNA